MATTYHSSRTTSTQMAKSRTGVVVDVCTFNVPAAGYVLNDIQELFKIPAGARILAFGIDCPSLDSNATAAVVLAVGDTNASSKGVGATGYISGNTQLKINSGGAAIVSYPVASAFTGTNGVQTGNMAHQYTVDDVLQIKVTTAPATATTSGAGEAWVMYEMDAMTQGTL